MNVMIVDDDFYVTKGLEMKINWERLSVEGVFIAHNARKAKEILRTTPIDIMICDIEMPQESGLELLSWIRENDFRTQTIFLTSYADFNYAKRALELGSLEYFLKPVDHEKLENGILKAIRKVMNAKEQEVYKRHSHYWLENKQEIICDFWRKMIFEYEVANESDIKWWITGKNVPYLIDDQFVLVRIDFSNKNAEFEKWRKTLLSFAVRNIISEQFQIPDYSMEAVLMIEDKSWLIIMKVLSETKDSKMLREQSIQLNNEMQKYFKMDANVYIGQHANLFQFNEQLGQLKEMSSNCIGKRNIVVEVNEYHKRVIEYKIPAVGLWEIFIKEGKKDVLFKNIQLYLHNLVDQQIVNGEILKLIKLDVTQMVYHYLREKSISAHKLFSTEENEKLYKNADNSVEDLEKYFEYLIEHALEYCDFARKPVSVVEQLKGYLDQNFQNDISRNDLAELVYLHQDYISRLFSKEVGISISGYLMEKRIEKACELLVSTEIQINEISNYVGYSNYSYFTKMFKERIGCSPNEYRKRKLSEK